MDGRRKNRLSRRAIIGAGGAAAAIGAAYSAFRGSDQRRIVSRFDAQTFNRGNGAEPDTLDPHLASTINEDNIIGDMFLGLTTEDARGNPVPGRCDRLHGLRRRAHLHVSLARSCVVGRRVRDGA